MARVLSGTWLAPRDVLAAPDAETAIPAGLLETARWMAGYYGAPLGLALKCMLPGGMWGVHGLSVDNAFEQKYGAPKDRVMAAYIEAMGVKQKR